MIKIPENMTDPTLINLYVQLKELELNEKNWTESDKLLYEKLSEDYQCIATNNLDIWDTL